MSTFSQLVLMLSSDQDGEVVAAARAIDRKLRASSLDWHWLAKRIDGEGSNRKVLDVRKMAEFVSVNRRHVRQKDVDFIRSILSRLDVYGDDVTLTERQMNYLKDLYARCRQ